MAGEPMGSLIKIRIRIENLSAMCRRRKNEAHSSPSSRPRRSPYVCWLCGMGRSSLLDPPEWARQAVTSCMNLHTWPVLVGEEEERDVMLSSPIILYDYPQVAPESPGEMFDATEIDEILALRTMTLTDDEKAEARATDSQAAAIIDRVDTLPPRSSIGSMARCATCANQRQRRQASRRTFRGGIPAPMHRSRRKPTASKSMALSYRRDVGSGCGPDCGAPMLKTCFCKEGWPQWRPYFRMLRTNSIWRSRSQMT